MTIPEVIITVCCTVAGSAAIAYITFYLQAKWRERTLFRALYGEIKGNRRLAEQQREDPMLEMGRAPERGPLYTEAYQNIRLAGELLTLPESIRQKLEYIYELINMNNRKIPSITDAFLDEDVCKRIDKIIQNLKYLEDELPKHISSLDTRNHKPQHEPQEDLLRRYLMAQVPTFFFFGLLAILAYYLSSPFGWLLLLIGAIAISWAFVLAVVAFDLKMPRKLKRAEEAIIQWVEGKNASLHYAVSYIASMVVFAISFTTIFVEMIRADVSALPLYISYGIAMLLTFMLCGHSIRSAWHRKQTKTTTTQNNQSQNQDA